MSYFKELQDLEDQGIDLVEVLGQDRHLESPEALQKIVVQLHRNGESLYSELLYYLTYRRFSPEQAESMWRAIMKHKHRMSEALGRRVSFRVAALDHLSARMSVLRNVRLIAKPEFESILSYVNVDEVTAVYNRRYFNETLVHEVRRARRYGNPLSLLIVDIDDFKLVNDAWGHLEGDAVLRRLGRLLRENTRQTDSVCRFGGDEFALLLPEASGAEAYALAERIRRAPSRSGLVPGREEKVRPGPSLVESSGEDAGAEGREASRVLTLSIGGATYPTDCDEAEELVALADQMCLDAKRLGKNRVQMTQGRQGLSRTAE
ncbi:MAG: GGDEF domain-containing protein [Planctomycetes bacterium]|nr:GGDEF domain-containing protein [Planctomycetota bacterium]